MKVVIIDGDISYPPTSGKRLRTLHLMLPLADRHQITYLARGMGDTEHNRRAETFLRDHGIEPLIVDDPLPRKKGAAFYGRLAGNLFSALPYSVASHQSQRMQQAAAEYAREHPVDLWQLEWTGYLSCLPANAGASVVQAHNVDSLIWQRYYETEKNPLKKWYIRQQWQKFHRFEQDAFHRVSRVIAVSQEDANLAKKWFDVENVDVVDNGVDVAGFRDLRPVEGSRNILYLGALDWRPNLDAVNLLLDQIFPLVRVNMPEAKLVIVGRSPPAGLQQRITREPGVELHADVPDVKPYLSSSAVMAVPLRIGGGSRLKILESLAAGLPVVSTRIGAEGLTLQPRVDFTQADSSEDMASALIDALRNPDRAREQAEHGRKTVAERYDWNSLAARLEQVWEKALQSRTVKGDVPQVCTSSS